MILSFKEFQVWQTPFGEKVEKANRFMKFVYGFNHHGCYFSRFQRIQRKYKL